MQGRGTPCGIQPQLRAPAPLLLERSVMWQANSTASEPCDDGSPADFLAALGCSDDVLMPIRTESIQQYSPLGERRYRAFARPLRLPGLSVTPTAVIRVETDCNVLRYVTEEVKTEYEGAVSNIVRRLQPPAIEASSTLRATEDALSFCVEFRLEVPLPSWWPLPLSDADAAGSSLIRDIVQRDARRSVERVKVEYAAWQRTQREVQ